MKKYTQYKAVLLAALGLASVTVAQADTSDVWLGFNDLAGPNSAQNDYVIDLGSYSLFTTTSIYTGSIDGGLFTQAFGTDGNALNDVAVGVAEGYAPTSGTKLLMQTATSLGSLKTLYSGDFGFPNAEAQGAGAVLGVFASSTGITGNYGFSYDVAQSPTVQGAYQDGGLAGNDGNPMQYLSSGVVTETLFENTQATTRNATPSGWSEVGTFTINANNDTVTFQGVDAVPEPTTCSLLGGAGLLILALRNKLNRKNA